MKIAKTKLLGSLAIISSLMCGAQVKVPVTNNDLRNNLEKIISDFPNHLSSIKGDTLEVNPQTVEFVSLLDFKMASQHSITQYKSAKPVYSWQATLLTTEEFEEAAKKYKWLYNQLKVMTVKMEGGYSFTLNGEYDKPDESRKFCSSIFKLTPNASNIPKLKIEASMQFEFPEWKVSIRVYEREREDNERGEIYGE
ncbi:MAG TPA: hypothetical protein VFR58_00390 [Flavisolibacter sp.]|nr:hypothetical protein [Flavisolibacter sp.]